MRDEAVEEGAIVVAGCAEGEEVLEEESGWRCFMGLKGERREELLTSAVLGTLSQKTSILRSPRLVCSVTDMLVIADMGPQHCLFWFVESPYK